MDRTFMIDQKVKEDRDNRYFSLLEVFTLTGAGYVSFFLTWWLIGGI